MLIAQEAAAARTVSSHSTASRRRPDIEGLRAVAVLAVIFDHLIHWPQGGFIGVDIFFVISGYLISGILLREAQATGKISFKQFYIRRIKRILPAALLVLSATISMSYILYYAGRANAIAIDGLWSILFSANWRFAILGTDYMNSGSSVSPLQHYWSLGVEEQFYIIWPWVILGGLFCAKKLRLNDSGTVAILGVAVSVPLLASFVYSLWETETAHTVAYFSTFSRAWELAIGALIAVTTASFKGFGKNIRAIFHWSGLALIFVSLFAIGPDSAFPGPFALFPVLGASLVILAGCGSPVKSFDKIAIVLTNPISCYLGKISYSLYLWHFPVIIFLTAFLPEGSRRYYVIAVVLMFALSVASFAFVEDPIRRGSFGVRRLGGKPADKKQSRISLALFTTIIIVAPVTAFATFGNQAQTITGAESLSEKTASTAEERQAMLANAISATEWPKLNPDPAAMGPDGYLVKPDEWIKDGCLGGALSPLAHDTDVVVNAQRCVYGNAEAPNSMIIFGDSTTMSYVPGIRKALEGQDWKISIYTVAGCSPTLVDTNAADASAEECVGFKAWVVEQIRATKPTVVVSSFLRNDNQLQDGIQGAAADAQWQKQVANMGRIVTSVGAEYVLLGAPQPAKFDPSQCISRVSKPADCLTPLAENASSNEVAMENAMKDIGSHATYISVNDWFCYENICPAFIGNTAIYADINHITKTAAEDLSSLLKNEFDHILGSIK